MKNKIPLKKKIKKIGITGLLLSSALILGVGSITPVNASTKHSKHWHWEESLSLRRADKNINKSNHSNKKVRRDYSHTESLYLTLRKHGYSKNQSIVILALAQKSSSLNNYKFKLYKGAILPVYGYFSFLGKSREPLIKYAKQHHQNMNNISTQFNFLVSRSGYSFKSDKSDTLVKLARHSGSKLFVVQPFKTNQSARNTIKYIQNHIN